MKYLIDKEVLNNRLAFFTVPTDIWEAIQHTPIVDAVPVKHGRWIDDGLYSDNFPHHAWHCSECEESVLEIAEPWFKFCPSCGAYMRKDGDGNETD